ncbi:protein GDAP2 homolog, partial [Diaphorina citri]|uniref:Protein GDAP2 homolog n=1 Tax=Diaphorina citri TaxID=121845 RepID=A0A3Q0IU62_DIACI
FIFLFLHRYKKNLKACYIVHPTFWTKMMTWWFTTFMAPAIKQKVHSIPGVEYLYSIISPNQLEIPAFITEYDMTVSSTSMFLCLGQAFQIMAIL